MRELTAGPHTLAFGLYLAAMTAGLLAHSSWLYAGFFGGLLGLLIWFTRKSGPDARACSTIASDAFYPIALNLVFPAMAVAVPAIRGERFDAALFALDARYLGGSWSERLEPAIRPALTELMSLCYLFFMPLLYASLVRYFFWQRERRASFLAGLFTIYGFGFLGYLLVPAAGPYFAFAGLFTVPLGGGPLWHLNEEMVAFGSNGVDVFPSLHAAVSVYILGFAYRHARQEFWWLLLPVSGICVSTIYLRYHYLIDVICGLALALIGLTAGLYQERRLRGARNPGSVVSGSASASVFRLRP
jgi:membrane-associated phospholipid phosphatase